MNTIVNFKLAKLLKEKGFNLETREYFLSNVIEYSYPENWNLRPDTISAPTIVDTIMWAYDYHSIWIECLHRGDMGDFTFKVSKLKKRRKTQPHYLHYKGFNSPLEAYEEAIEYALNNLIQ